MDPGRTNPVLYGQPRKTPNDPHAGDGNQATGRYGANPLAAPPSVDNWTEGDDPLYGRPSPLDITPWTPPT